jgi:hypothetical protein
MAIIIVYDNYDNYTGMILSERRALLEISSKAF